MIKNDIEKIIQEALAELGAGEVPFVVERPAEMEHGDYATNAALAASKILKQNPKEVAEQLAAKLALPAVERVEIAGAGFINFFLTREAIVKEVEAAANKKEWGNNDLYGGKKVMVEYTQPNPFKPFHIGHLMSNTMGESIAHLFENAGAKVTRVNYQGDVGPHVAKALYALLARHTAQPTIEEIGAAYVEGTVQYEADPEAKKTIDEINKKVYERSEPQVNELYDWGRKISLEHFEEIYRTLGTKFDFYFFESETAPVGLKLVQAHPEVFEHSDGATVFKGEQYGLHTRVFVTSLGLPTYETKELGLVEAKKEKGNFDISLTVTAHETSEYFKVVRKAAEMIFPDLEGKMLTRFHGMLRLTSGKMSSRKGNIITGESLLRDMADEAKEKMKDRKVSDAKKIAEQVAVGAIKYTVLKQGSGKDIIFDPAKSLSLEGDSGPYLQYAHTRALSLIKAAHAAGVDVNAPLGKSDFPKESSALERTLLHFPEVLAHAAQDLEPHYVTTYLTELAAAFNSWYASERVIGGKHEPYGVLLAQAVEQTLAKGLQVLGIPAPEEM